MKNPIIPKVDFPTFQLRCKELRDANLYRKGQTLMDLLLIHRPDLYEDLRVSGEDPSYVDDTIQAALTYVELHWDSKEPTQ